MSVLSKDNGLAWAIVPPIMAFTFDKIDKHTLKKDLAFGFGIAISYAVIRLTIPSTYVKMAVMRKMWSVYTVESRDL